ncbi:hypothetical protein [Okeania sp. SIO1I7]|uniref:hypothetical protein n=1 Tax=Okeania sp. SIO1I7 TaxID=2607772 RepID=UPI0025FDA191|nr:hypothetical protein [Okeania sp. SIO1I7]
MNNYPKFSDQGYQIIKELGHNNIGGRVTYLAKNINTQKKVVIKQFKFAKLGATWAEYDAYEQEIAVLKSLNYPGIPHISIVLQNRKKTYKSFNNRIRL